MDIAKLSHLAHENATADFGSADSLERCNAAADELRSELAKELAIDASAVLTLLDQPVLGAWVAYTALDSVALSPNDEARCLSVIQAIAAGDDLSSIGASHWLAQRGSPT